MTEHTHWTNSNVQDSLSLAAAHQRVQLVTGQIHLSENAVSTADPRRYHCTLFQAGKNLNGWTMPIELLGANINKFAGVPCHVDHHWSATLEKLAGSFENPILQDNAIAATLRLNQTPAGTLLETIFDAWLEDKDAGLDVSNVGLSSVFWLRFDQTDGELIASEILKVESTDAVLYPAAGGRVERVLNSVGAGKAPAMAQGVGHQPGAIPQERSNTMPKEDTTSAQGDVVQESTPPPDQSISNSETLAAIQRLSEHIQTLNTRVDDLTIITAEAEAERTVTDMGIAPRDAQIVVGRDSLDQVRVALDALLAGVRPPDGIRPFSGIKELYTLLSGDYDMSGEFNAKRVLLANVNTSTMAKMTADALNKRVKIEYQRYPRWWEKIVTMEDFTSLQDVKWITLGGIGELPTVAEGAAYTEATWDDIQQTDTFLKKGRYIGLTMEAIDKDDTRRLQSAPRALAQAAWLTLSKSISTIFTVTSGTGPSIYYNDSSTRVLFHSSNSNLGSTALSAASWKATRLAMRKQTEHHSGERLGALTAPKFLLVPPDLEFTAIQIMATAQIPGSGDWNINPEAAGDAREARLATARERVVVVDLWTETADWCAIADPLLYPSIGLAFRYGRTPEIFSVTSPTAGLMFTNDVMPIKVRFFYATGPIDWRGMYKQNP